MAPASIKHSLRSGKAAHSKVNSRPSMKQLSLLFLALILAAQNRPIKAMELPADNLASRTLHSATNRRLLDDTVVSDYTKWCTPSRGELL